MDAELHLLFLWQESKYLSTHRHTDNHHPPGRNLADLHRCLTDYWTGLAQFLQISRQTEKARSAVLPSQFILNLSPPLLPKLQSVPR